MQTHVHEQDDEQFEAYLKRFHPIAPEAIPTLSASSSSRRPLSPEIWLTAVAAVIVLAVVILHIRSSRVVISNAAGGAAAAERNAPSELTMRSANAWLATAPSFKAAVDELAFRSQTSPLPKGEQSAVAVLSKEKIRL
ncbi:MAG TPA: hypothetical protein VMD99_18005 [Terriglobales bacterium]|nr:hypothetical protein [Terriglobales bacterium]